MKNKEKLNKIQTMINKHMNKMQLEMQRFANEVMDLKFELNSCKNSNTK